ncbi:LuxR family transcriptional regulator [Asticcacaulis sp. DW145]|uniref:helix-turn-helix transcriptional regulator n=1 Tax=Asticcacaulis sp. DW145 TaxID=3095608 RepID=UPI003093AA62|nr:LuxR family transcriptional regulator [Asticcacaulis sp. DW145]
MLYANGEYSLEQFIEDTSRVKSVERLFEVFIAAMANLGFDRVNFSVMRDLDLDASAQGFGLISTYPAVWQDYYADNGLARIDPVVKWAVGSVRPFRWNDIEHQAELTRRQRHFLREAEEGGLCNGIGVPFPGPRTLRGGIALATSVRRSKQMENLDVLAAYCHQFYVVYKRLVPPGLRLSPAAAALTRTEQEVLMRIAHGLSNEVIAHRLGIKAGSVDFHVQNIFRKLKVNNRTAAATKGLMGGYIEV